MVWSSTRYHCGQCSRTYSDFEEARQCEQDHIVAEAVGRTAARIKEAFKTPPETAAG